MKEAMKYFWLGWLSAIIGMILSRLFFYFFGV